MYIHYNKTKVKSQTIMSLGGGGMQSLKHER
nr:MAG TPA_asm: hypothetical protein [Caudoviricetes sp.]